MTVHADSLRLDMQATPADLPAAAPFALPNKQRRRLGLYAAMAGADAAALILGFVLSSWLLFGAPVGWQATRLTGLVLPLFVIFALSQRAYGVDALTEPSRGATRAVFALSLALGIVLMLLHQLGVLHQFYGWIVVCAAAFTVPLIVLGRKAMRRIGAGALADQPVSDLIIADDVPVRSAAHQFVVNAAGLGIAPDVSNPHMLDRVGKLLKNVDRVTVACAPERRDVWTLVLKGAGVSGEVRTSEAATPFGAEPIDIFAERYAVFSPPSPSELAMKRCMDLALVVPALVFVAPLLAVLAIAIKIDSPGPVLFVQDRIGRGNRLFKMYKLRTMHVESTDADGSVSARRDDCRVTRLGRTLRATSMDELPQLINILLGSMSLVGPRPHALGSTASEKLFWDIDRRYWLRHACAPGLTGLAQVRGFRGATLHSRDLENRLAADLEYMRSWSLWLDVKILLMTFGVIVHRNAF
jgi:lipopolysaccharide/colanic/teichoic acid biosynthesis glycosyltransferase